MNLKKILLTSAAALSIALTPTKSLEDIPELSRVSNKARMSGKHKIVRNPYEYCAAWKNNKFYIYTDKPCNIFTRSYEISPMAISRKEAKNIIFGYNFANALEDLDTNQLREEFKTLKKEINITQYTEIKNFLKETSNFDTSFDLILNMYNDFRDMAVDPKFLAEAIIGEKFRDINTHYENTLNKIDKSDFDDVRVGEIIMLYDSLEDGDPFIVPAINFLRDLRNTKNPDFDKDPELVEMYKEIVYSKDVKFNEKKKVIVEKIVEKIINSPEWKRFEEEFKIREEKYHQYINNERNNEFRNMVNIIL